MIILIVSSSCQSGMSWIGAQVRLLVRQEVVASQEELAGVGSKARVEGVSFGLEILYY